MRSVISSPNYWSMRVAGANTAGRSEGSAPVSLSTLSYGLANSRLERPGSTPAAQPEH
jgi:hypothetical protein